MARLDRGVFQGFAKNPTLSMPRSSFMRSPTWLGTGNAGDIIPVYCDMVYPGDTVRMEASALTRMSTPIHPVMDSAFQDTHFFFVPMRLVWEHWKEFNGENNESYWIPQTDYAMPVQASPEGGYNFGTVADFMGVPPGVEFDKDHPINAWRFRAYAKIYNDWWRNQNTDHHPL